MDKILPMLAVQALVQEAELSPKPGLVDSIDNGSHNDMNLALFKKSAQCFLPFFADYYKIGSSYLGNLTDLLCEIRQIGVMAEDAMFQATKGVNTHKGANFTMALFISAAGYYFKHKSLSTVSSDDIKHVFSIVATIADNLVQKDFVNIVSKKDLTYGEYLYTKYDFSGIRGEAQLGYPTIVKLALPELLKLNTQEVDSTRKYLQILMVLITETKDSNLLSRGGWQGIAYAQACARGFIGGGGVFCSGYRQKLQQINESFIARNLSPGGSADLLSLVILIDKMLMI